MMRYGVGFSFREIFFTHYHADHMLGAHGADAHHGAAGPDGARHALRPEGRRADPGRGAGAGHRADPVPGGDRRGAGRATGWRAPSTTWWRSRRITAPTPSAGRWWSTSAWAGSIRSARASWAFPEGPLWGRIHKGQSVTLESGREVTPAELVGPHARGAHGGLQRRYTALPERHRRVPRRRPADSRGDVRHRGAGARRGDGALDRARRPREWRGRRACGGWCSRTSAPATPATRPSSSPRRGRSSRT